MQNVRRQALTDLTIPTQGVAPLCSPMYTQACARATRLGMRQAAEDQDGGLVELVVHGGHLLVAAHLPRLQAARVRLHIPFAQQHRLQCTSWQDQLQCRRRKDWRGWSLKDPPRTEYRDGLC